MNLMKKSLVLLILLLFIPVLLVGIKRVQDTRKGATDDVRIAVYVSGDVLNMEIGDRIDFSALVYDQFQPQSNYIYKWTISSENSIGRLVHQGETVVNSFIAMNGGGGYLVITARPKNFQGTGQITKSIRLFVVSEEGTECSNSSDCFWCGQSCLPVSENLPDCPHVMPPPDKDCGCVNGRCAVSDFKQVSCFSRSGEVLVTPLGGEGTCHDVQEAVNVALSGDVIKLSSGMYQVEPQRLWNSETGLLGISRYFSGRKYLEVGIIIPNGKTVTLMGDKDNLSLISGSSYLDAVILLTGSGSDDIETANNKRVIIENINISGGYNSLLLIDRLANISNVIAEVNYLRGEYSGLRIISTDEELSNQNLTVNIENSVINNADTGKGIVASLSSGKIGLSVFESQTGKIDIHGFSGAKPDNEDSLTEIAINSCTTKYINFFGTNVNISNSIIEGGYHSYMSKGIISNNTIIGYDIGLRVGCLNDYNIYNNIVTGSNNSGVSIIVYPGLYCHEGPLVENSGFRSNNVWNNNPNYYSGGETSYLGDQTGQNGNISDDPLLGDDYCLMSGSPAIGSGEGGENMGAVGVCKRIVGDKDCSCKTISGKLSKSNGDANCDGKTSMFDFNIWLDTFVRGSSDYENNADYNCDGRVTIHDFGYWRSGFFN